MEKKQVKGSHTAPSGKSAKSYDKSAYVARRGHNRKRPQTPLIIAIAVICILVLILGGCFFSGQCSSKKGKVKQGEQITVAIPAGASTSRIADLLVDNGVIASDDEFSKRVEKLGQASSLQSGTYVFTGGDDLDNIIHMMTSGETGYELLIPEGYTLKQIAAAVEKTCGINADEFYAQTQKASSYVNDYPFVQGAYNDSLEGFLYPDTYRIDVGATSDQIIRKMLDQFAAQVATVDMSYATSKNLTLYDVLTLASMVEKEHRTQDDKAAIAAVFYNRLHEGIVLGSDVTTYYAVGKDLTEELTLEDLASDSPYNTRHPQHYGLPAGPICNPSVSSINAAANPAQVDYLYFFYSNKQNQTMFFVNDVDFNAAWAQFGD